MGRINLLSFEVANLIAAGEVVDRPSSVIKELLENAIDAGATAVTVEIQNGGITLMRVSDNGCGMEVDDLQNCVKRHATSKIKNAEDLDGILTLGFRGEALAAIAAVSDLRILSRTQNASFGHMLTVSGGKYLGCLQTGCPQGTTVIVENLFKNVPARRKFLKRDITEAMAVGAVVEKIALSRPDVAFKYICDGTVKAETVGDGNVRSVLYALFGRKYAQGMIEIEGGDPPVRIHGWIGRSDNVRSNRNYENFFLNGRYVRSKTMSAAIEQAYTSYMPQEKFPCCVIYVDISPEAVDVNVHPAKLEVKFSNEKPVFEAVYYTVRQALEANNTRPSIDLSAKRQSAVNAFVPIPSPYEKDESEQMRLETYRQPTSQESNEEDDSAGVISAATTLHKYSAIPTDPSYAPPHDDSDAPPETEYVPEQLHSTVIPEERDDPMPAPEIAEPVSLQQDIVPTPTPQAKQASSTLQEEDVPLKTYRIVGEVFNSYVIVEYEEKMLLIDKHAAHERIIFEKLKIALHNAEHASQLLMVPVEVMLTSDEVAVIEQYRAELEAIGFEMSAGRYTVSVSAVPDAITAAAVPDMLAVIADRLKNDTGNVKLTRDIIFEKALYQASCKAAIKAGREYADSHIEWLVDQLMTLGGITFCPHGRPVAMEITRGQLNSQFERT
ncbi:MAG: DNA mismatch repair endonuclease MutL [Clostridia bacterium]|nr:DNA mismatch repair endonuclease MutL [Clostridia bacterium]